MLKNFNWKKTGLFVGGVLFGTIGIKAFQVRTLKNVTLILPPRYLE